MTFYSWLSLLVGLEPSATQLETKSRFRDMLDPDFRTQSLTRLQRALAELLFLSGGEGLPLSLLRYSV